MSVQRWQCWVWQHVSWLCLEVASHTSNFRADSLTCALGWVIWILWCLRHFEFQLWWCWWKLEEADRNKGNSKHKKMGAMSLWTHSQMGLGIGALGVPELRRIPSGQLEPPGLLLKRGLEQKYCQLGLRGDWSLNMCVKVMKLNGLFKKPFHVC